LEKNHPRPNPIDRTKHDEDIAERMIGGARMDRRAPAEPQQREQIADDRSRPARPSHDRRRHP
jgi:hypothetical protein